MVIYEGWTRRKQEQERERALAEAEHARREAEAREEGREEERQRRAEANQALAAWWERYQQAKKRGEEFNEPPPLDRNGSRDAR